MLLHWKPSAPRHVLFAVAGVLWMIAGALLCIRGIIWLGELRLTAALATAVLAVILGFVFYKTLFSHLVTRNIERIRLLPDRPCVFAFTAVKGYVMIGLMMTAGFALRNSSLPKYYLSLPYTSMGGVLVAGSIQFCRQFLVGQDSHSP
jgi:hypothetical protein